MLPDQIVQRLGVDRFGQVTDHPGSQTFFALFAEGVRGLGDDR